MHSDTPDKNMPGFPDEESLMSLEEATRLLKADFGSVLNQTIISYSNFVTFGNFDEAGEYQLRGNGSCFFLRTPRRLMVITAAHVFDGIVKAKKENPKAVASIGSMVFDFEERLIATGKSGEPDDPSDVDIATFDLTETELKKLSNKMALEYWPPYPPTEGHGIAFVGYPAQEIIQKRNGTRSFAFYVGTSLVKRVTDRQLEIDLGHRNLSDALVYGKVPQPGYNTGGMSGGPVLTMKHHRKTGFMLFILGGVIAGGRFETDTILAERADCIRSDGSIRRWKTH